jgi:hypothetical protein
MLFKLVEITSVLRYGTCIFLRAVKFGKILLQISMNDLIDQKTQKSNQKRKKMQARPLYFAQYQGKSCQEGG